MLKKDREFMTVAVKKDTHKLILEFAKKRDLKLYGAIDILIKKGLIE